MVCGSDSKSRLRLNIASVPASAKSLTIPLPWCRYKINLSDYLIFKILIVIILSSGISNEALILSTDKVSTKNSKILHNSILKNLKPNSLYC